MTELDALITQIQALSDDQWGTLHATLLVEAGVVTGPEATTPESWAESGTGAPAWVDPGTIHHRMYLRGAVVSHQGRVWESTHPGLNHWEPGAVGVDSRIWEDITDRYQPADPEQEEPPAGEAPPYQVGVEYQPGSRFTWQGRTYEVLQAHTSAAHWPPDQAHSLYQPI